MDNNNDQNRNNNKKGGNRQTIFILLAASLVMLLILSYMRTMLAGAANQKISYDEFLAKVDAGEIESVEISRDEITVTPKTQPNPYVTQTFYTVPVDDDNLPDRLLKAGVKFEQKESNASEMIMSVLLSYVLPIVLVWIVLSFVMRRMSKGGGVMGVGKSTAKVYIQKETGITFRDVAGQDEAKESLQEVVDLDKFMLLKKKMMCKLL